MQVKPTTMWAAADENGDILKRFDSSPLMFPDKMELVSWTIPSRCSYVEVEIRAAGDWERMENRVGRLRIALQNMLDFGGTTPGEWMPADIHRQAKAALAEADHAE